ncbi:MAG: uracil-DNA glycosylase [Rubritalea sp.]|uniref:uracil-DNA glycosylase n=1 Tax=Rubritalea sp. TaxID=2109375 RepID=UPI003241F35F
MSAVAEPLIDYLRQLERQGETYVHLDDRSRLILREFFVRARGKSKNSSGHPQVSSVAEREVEQAKVQVAEVVAPAIAPAIATLASEPKVAAVTAQVSLSNSLEGLKHQLAEDAELKSLGTLRDKLIFSEGDISADVMLVGEAPTYHDELKGAPFSGPAGKKMEEILKAMGLERGDVYLTNIVKYRPSMPNQTTNTRMPNAAEIQASMGYLMAEVAAVKPKVLIVLGATAAKSLIGAAVPVSNMLGQFHKVAGIPVRATYHPSYLLHAGITDEKRAVWKDMMEVMELLEMPISERQRGFFKKK